MSGTSENDVESLIEAARNYGTDDPEQEIEALQDLLRVAWSLMTERQQAALLQSDEALTVLEAEEDEFGRGRRGVRAKAPHPPVYTSPAKRERSRSNATRERVDRSLRRHALRPFHLGRQAHQDGLDVAAGLQAEQCSPVVDQVELNIAAAAHQLLLTLVRRPAFDACAGARCAGRHRGMPARHRA